MYFIFNRILALVNGKLRIFCVLTKIIVLQDHKTIAYCGHFVNTLLQASSSGSSPDNKSNEKNTMLSLTIIDALIVDT